MSTAEDLQQEFSTIDINRTNLSLDRTVLANERTCAAWIRTGLAAFATGLCTAKFMTEILPLWNIQIIMPEYPKWWNT